MTGDEVDKIIEQHLKALEIENRKMKEAGFDPDDIEFEGTGNF